MTGSVCEGKDLMDGGVIAIRTERARTDVGVCQGWELYTLEDLDIQLHVLKKHTHTRIHQSFYCSGILWSEFIRFLITIFLINFLFHFCSGALLEIKLPQAQDLNIVESF